MSLPHSSNGMSCSAQNSLVARSPALHSVGLQAAGFVVDAGVDDAAVVPGLVSADAVLGLDDDDRRVGVVAQQAVCRRESDDARADNAVAEVSHRRPQSLMSWPSMRRHRPSGLPSAMALGSNDFGTSW